MRHTISFSSNTLHSTNIKSSPPCFIKLLSEVKDILYGVDEVLISSCTRTFPSESIPLANNVPASYETLYSY